jgi:hypothetical protein
VDEEGYALVPNELPYDDFIPGGDVPEPDFEGGGFGNMLPPPPDEINFDDFDVPMGFGDAMDLSGSIGGFRPLREDAYGYENTTNPYLMQGQTHDTVVSPLEMGDYPGAAGMYSRTERAAQNLKQQTYPDLAQVRKELEARGAPGKELDTQMDFLNSKFPVGEKISRDEIQKALNKFRGLIVNRSPSFANDYAPAGGYNGTSTYYTHEDVPVGPGYAYDHFGKGAEGGPPPLAHSRAAQYDITVPGGGTEQTHHVIEIQSDWAQYRQTLPKNDEEVMKQAQNLVREGKIEEAQNIPTRSEMDELFPAPYVKNENDWLDLGVRQNLIDAVNSGSDWITFGNGAQANRHIKMPIEAARRFYDQQVPKSVDRVLKKFAREAGIEAPQLQKTPFVDGEEVYGFKLTPEFREAMRKTNLPSFKDGGLVSLGVL